MAAAGVFTHQTPASRSTAIQPPAPLPARRASKDKAIEEKGDTIAIRGRVFDPDGKPFSGAKIYLIGPDNRPQKIRVRAVSGSDGRFHFTFPKTEYFEAAWIRVVPKMWLWCDIVAAAPGYGPARMFMRDVPPELSLHLRKEVRIEGRVRDLEGRPVEDAEVRVIGPYMVGSWSHLIDAVATDKEGRFRLTGVGRDMEMELRVSAPTIQTQWIKVKTPAKGPIAPIEVLAPPTKPIDKSPLTVRLQPWGTLTGRLVDAKGKPLADAKVRLKYPDSPDSGMKPPDQVFATDHDGRFRVEGLLPTRDHELILEPGTKKDVALSAGDALKKLKTHAGEKKHLREIIVKVASVQPSKK